MVRLVWLAANRDDPEESFPPLAGIRPAPEPLAFSAATPEAVARRLPNVILVDGRGQPEEAAATIQKLRNDTEAAFLAVMLPGEVRRSGNVVSVATVPFQSLAALRSLRGQDF